MSRPQQRVVVISLGLAGSALFIFLAVRALDFDDLKDAWSRATMMPWLPLGIASYLLGHVVRGARCRLLVRRDATIGLTTASNIVVVGYASNNVLPARLGELVRAGMLAERTGMPIAQSFAVTFIERVLDGLAILLLLVIGTLAADTPAWMRELVHVALAVFGIAALVMLAAAHSPSLILAAASRLGNRLRPAWHDRIVSLATSVINAGACLRDPWDAIRLAIYSIVVWLLETGLFVMLLPIFGLPLSLQTAMVAMSITNFGLLVPSTPGYVGPFHYICSRAVMAFGVGEATGLAYATLVHLAFFIPVTVWGALAMLRYGVELGSTAALARKAKRGQRGQTTIRGVACVELAPVAAAPPEVTASAMTIGLLEAIVVGEGQTPNAEAIEYAATFVDGQIAALSPKLRFLYAFGMTAFRAVTRLRFLRGYCDVQLEHRRRWTRAWAEGPLALVRQLFKPARAIGLLAYYDHPAVKRELVGADVVPSSALVRATAEPAA